MAQTLDSAALALLFRAAAAKVKAAEDELTQLDSATGDGDHGVAMKRAMNALEAGLDGCGDGGLKPMLQAVAMSVMSIDAGSTGPLMGSLMLGMTEPIDDRTELDVAAFGEMFAAGVKKLLGLSKANVGDKTMVDALVPGTEALQAAIADGADLPAALAQAAEAAEAGAAKTKEFQAKFGRARNLGERSIGHQDPGATSLSIFMRGLAEGAAAM